MVKPAGPFVFRAAASAGAGDAPESDRLADIVATRSFELDARALAARVLLLPPTHPGETPYRDVIAVSVPAPVGAAGRDAPRVATPRDAVAIVRRALDRALEHALQGVRRVAVMTGGGVDSSALLALAVERARRTGGTAFGVALDFGGPGDDRPHLAALEAHLGCEILRVRPEGAAHRIALVRSGVDAAPLTWPGGCMEIEMLARARANGAECALMGVGADELFDGNPRALAEIARRGDLAGALTAARRLEGFALPRSPSLTWVLRPLIAELLPTSIRAVRAYRTPARAPAWARPRLQAHAREWRDREIGRTLRKARTPRERFERLDSSPTRGHLAWLRHQEQVASGLERRDPFLDPELVATVSALPPEWLLHCDARRGLFREAVRGLLPESLRLRMDKASFEPAFARFVAAAGNFEALRDLAAVPHLAALDLVDPRAFREAFDAFSRHPDDGWTDVWPALAVEAFLQGRGVRA